MSYPARGPSLGLGIDGKAIRANRRHHDSIQYNRPIGGGAMSYPARRPSISWGSTAKRFAPPADTTIRSDTAALSEAAR